MRTRITALLDAVFPLQCAGCGAPSEALCASCLTDCVVVQAHPPPGIDAWAVVGAYRGALRHAVIAAKYRRRHRILDGFADLLAPRVVALGACDAVVAPPAARAHFAARGYDPAHRLAVAVAERLELPVLTPLRRTDDAPQTGRPRAERLRGPDLIPNPAVPARLLVVDDVVTTGGTLAAVARVLRTAGAQRVVAAVVARR